MRSWSGHRAGFLAELVAAVNHGATGVAKPFYEALAMNVFQKRCGLELPWQWRRRGDDKAGEPDFVIDRTGTIVVGFEITEVKDQEVREHNAALARRMAAKPLYQWLPKDRLVRQGMLHREARVEQAYAIVAGDSEFEKLQRFRLRLSEEALTARIIERLEEKKKKPYHQQAGYPVHVVVSERKYVICNGSKAEALRRAGIHDKGNLAGVWYLEADETLTRL